MITVSDLAKKLAAYAALPGNEKVGVLIQFDGGIAMEIARGDDHTAMTGSGIERFLVLVPDEKGKRLKLKTELQRGN